MIGYLERFCKKFISFVYILIPFNLLNTQIYLEASLINVDLNPSSPGFEDFSKGRNYFEEQDWNEAINCFDRAIKKSKKPRYTCSDFLMDYNISACQEEGSYCSYIEDSNTWKCEEYQDESNVYFIRDIKKEISYAVYRHSHFHFGLIQLYRGEIKNANFHFKRSIGFLDDKQMGSQFYRLINVIDPYWIILASLTNLQMGRLEEAEGLIQLAWETLWQTHLDEWEGSFWRAWNNIHPKYLKDLKEKKIVSDEWCESRTILLYTVKALVASNRNDTSIALYNFDKAIERKDWAVKNYVFPTHSPAYSVLYSNRGVFYAQQADHEKALLDFSTAIEFNCEDSKIYFCRGNVYLMLDEYSKAILDFKHASILDPLNFEYDRRIALGYAMMGDLNKAKKHLKVAKAKQNQLKNNQNELGLHAFSAGSYLKAVDHFNEFIEAAPNLANGYQNRGMTFFEVGDAKAAIDDFDQAIVIDPTNADLYQLRAIALMDLSTENVLEEKTYFKEAQSNFLNALELKPNDPKIYQNLAASHSLEGNFEASLECYTKALMLTSENEQYPILKNLILIHFERDEYEKALFYCEKAIQINRNDGEIYYIQGVCAFETNQFKQAIDHFLSAFNLGYKNNTLYFYRAKAFFCLQQFDKALEEASKALKSDPLNTECYKLRGLIFLSLNKEIEASEDFRKALSFPLESPSRKENQPGKFAEFKSKRLYFEHDLMTSIDEQEVYKSNLQSSIANKEGPLTTKLRQINLYAFEQGLALGLMEGGEETLKELLPFLAHLVFHPIDTAEEMLTAINFLISKAIEEDWETVCGALAPELKELFTDWDKIDDYQKGKLTGLFIGKNGVAALSVCGAVKTFSTLKYAIIRTPQTQFSRALKKFKSEVIPLSASELPSLPIPRAKEWQITCAEGGIIESSFVNNAPFVRFEQGIQHNKLLLEAKAIENLQALGYPHLNWEAFENSVLTKHNDLIVAQFRGIPTPVIEIEVTQIGSKGGRLEIAFNEKGGIAITNAVKPGKILVQNMNKQIHIMQPKHAWNKLIKLTGNIEEDCRNVVKLLEEHQIYLEKYRLDPVENYGRFIRYNYQKQINGHEVRAIFNKNLETGEFFLNDAWVVIK